MEKHSRQQSKNRDGEHRSLPLPQQATWRCSVNDVKTHLYDINFAALALLSLKADNPRWRILSCLCYHEHFKIRICWTACEIFVLRSQKRLWSIKWKLLLGARSQPVSRGKIEGFGIFMCLLRVQCTQCWDMRYLDSMLNILPSMISATWGNTCRIRPKQKPSKNRSDFSAYLKTVYQYPRLHCASNTYASLQEE